MIHSFLFFHTGREMTPGWHESCYQSPVAPDHPPGAGGGPESAQRRPPPGKPAPEAGFRQNISLDIYELNFYFRNSAFYEGYAMFLLANLIEALAKILDVALSLYTWVIIIRALLSWVNPDPYNVIVQFLYRATEPVLRPVRRWIPLRNFGIDLSPVIVILAIMFLQYFLVPSLIQLAFKLRS
jgi:YggT family protein